MLRCQDFKRLAYWLPVVLLLAVPPFAVEAYTLYNLTVYAVLALLALSLALAWGIGGIPALGQSAFFGIGAYAYAVVSINTGDSTWGILAAVVIAAVVALIIGYFTFFGRIGDIYFVVISLTFPLILFSLTNSASGTAFQIGKVNLGGYTGIPGVPPLNVPFQAARVLDYGEMYYVAAFTLLAAYIIARVIVASDFGRVAIAIREHDVRAGLLGYDARYYRLGIFCISALMAGLAGSLYAAWGASIGPTVFSLSFAAQTVVWVLVGGLGTLIGPIAGCIALQALSTWLGSKSSLNPEITLGALFVLVVLLLPNGIFPTVKRTVHQTFRSQKGRAS